MNEQWVESSKEGWIGDVLHAFLTNSEMTPPDEHFDDSPERALIRAVLNDAFQTILSTHSAGKARQQREMDVSWVEKDDWRNGGLTFTRACFMLDLNPEYMRKQLKKKLSEPRDEKLKGGPKPKDMRQRFEASFTVDDTGCWVWHKSIHKKSGVGKFRVVADTREDAPRVSWIIYRGKIPEGMFVRHTCTMNACVNPGHLYLSYERPSWFRKKAA